MSGGDHQQGWLMYFFPYVQWDGRHSRNPLLETHWNEIAWHSGRGLRADWLPSSLSSAPFKWTYLGATFDMQFVAGLIGVDQDPRTYALRPVFGWAVRDVAPRVVPEPKPTVPAWERQKQFERKQERLAAAQELILNLLQQGPRPAEFFKRVMQVLELESLQELLQIKERLRIKSIRHNDEWL